MRLGEGGSYCDKTFLIKKAVSIKKKCFKFLNFAENVKKAMSDKKLLVAD